MSRRLALLLLVLSAVLPVVPARAHHAAGIEPGSEIEVLAVEGLTLQVAPRAD